MKIGRLSPLNIKLINLPKAKPLANIIRVNKPKFKGIIPIAIKKILKNLQIEA